MSTHANRVKMTVTSVASAGTGDITLNAASTGFRSFATAYGANATVDILITEGTAWEIARNCTYTHSGTTVSRGTLENSSTGSAVAFNTSGTGVVVSVIAAAEFGNNAEMAIQAVTPGGRLTTESGVPVSTSDRTAQSTLYYTPYVHNIINLWDGSQWKPITFSEDTLALGTLTADRCHNVFAFLNAGALDLEIYQWPQSTVTISNASPGVVTWSSHGLTDGDMVSLSTTGTLPTGLSPNVTYYVVNAATGFSLAATIGGSAINTSSAGSGTHTAVAQRVTLQDGRYCKSGDKTRLLLGSFYSAAATTTEDSRGACYIWNAYNQRPRELRKVDTGSHVINNVAREWNNGTALRATFIVGLPTRQVMFASSRIQPSTTSSLPYLYAYVDGAQGTEGGDSNDFVANAYSTATTTLLLRAPFVASVGSHYISMFEAEFGSVNCTVDYGKTYMSLTQ